MTLETTILKSLFTREQLKDLQNIFNNEKEDFLNRLSFNTFADDETDETMKIWFKNYLIENNLIQKDDVNNDYHIDKLYNVTKEYFI